MGELKRIAVMMELDQPFKRHVSVYSGILDYAKEHRDWQIVVDEWADRTLPARRGQTVPYDGIVGRIGTLGADRARRLDVPAVNVWYSTPAKGLPCVVPDYDASGRLVAEHFIGRGLRYLAAVLQSHDKGTARQAAVMEEVAKRQGSVTWLGATMIDEPTAHEEWLRGLRSISRSMADWKVPLGLLIGDPAAARVIIELCRERGWHVPEQIAIVCSHNDELHCERPEPSLTAVEFSYEQNGYEAARILDALIDAKRQGEPPPDVPTTVILPPAGIIKRQSTDFFAVENPLVQMAIRYIATHLHKPLSVTSVANAVGVPRRTLDGWFANALGATVALEITRLRIERVKRELTAGDDLIETIAVRTGFASTRTLNDQFKRVTGMSPSEFRERGRARANP